jgi:hypothetical protein
VAENGLLNALETHSTASTDGGSGRPREVKVHYVDRTPSNRISTVETMSKQEDWLHIATADPAFWLNDIS